MIKLNEITPAMILDYLKGVDKKTWIKVGVISFVALLFLIFIAYPAWIGRLEAKAQLDATTSQVAQTNNLFRRKPEFLSLKEECTKFVQSSKEKLYTPAEASLLLGAISKMANDSKVSIVASKPKPAEGKFPVPFDGLYESSLYDVTLEGGYHALGDFVSRVESNPKILRIQSLTIHPKDDNAQVRLADLTLAAISVKQGKT